MCSYIYLSHFKLCPTDIHIQSKSKGPFFFQTVCSETFSKTKQMYYTTLKENDVCKGCDRMLYYDSLTSVTVHLSPFHFG